MKKFYSVPSMVLIDVETEHLLAGSYLDNGTDEEAGARFRLKHRSRYQVQEFENEEEFRDFDDENPEE